MANVISGVPASDLAFVQHGNDPNGRRAGNGLTRLHVAAKHGLADEVRKLLKQGAEVDAETPRWGDRASGRTALHIAAEANQVEVARALLDGGADVNRLGAGSLSTALYYTKNEPAYREMIKLLLERGTDPVWGIGFGQGWKESKPVKAPMDYESKKVKEAYAKWVKKTFEKGKPDETDEHGRTLLFLAVMVDEQEIAEKMLASGADINMKNRLVAGSLESAKVAGMTPLMALVCEESTARVEDWIRCGADVHATDAYGHSVLWVCAAQRHGTQGEHAKILVKAGADARKGDKRGVTPLEVARRLSDLTRHQLHALGYPTTELGVLAYDAIQQRDLAQLEALIAQGLDVNAGVNVGEGEVDLLETAVYECGNYVGWEFAESPERKMVTLLVKAGARVKRVTRQVIKVMAEEQYSLGEVLREAGVELDKPDAYGVTPMEREIAGGNWPEAYDLVKAGAKVDGARGMALLRETIYGPGAAVDTLVAERKILSLLRENLGAQPVSVEEFYDAVSVGDVQAVERCLEAGFSVNEGRDEVMRIRRENPDMAEYVRLNGKPRNPIAFVALYAESKWVFKLLVEAGADLGAVNIQGERLMDDWHCRELLKQWGIKPVAAKAAEKEPVIEKEDEGDFDPEDGEAPVTSEKLRKLAEKFDEELTEKLEERDSPVWAKKPAWQKVSKSAAYQAAIAELEKELGVKGEEEEDAYGVMRFMLADQAAVTSAVERLREVFEKKGYLLMALDMGGPQLQGVGLFAGLNEMDALAAFGTGSTWNIGSGDLIWFLKRLGKKLEVKVVCLGRNCIDLEFPGKIPDADKLAAELYAFAPDIVEQGAGSIDRLSKQIAKRKHVRLEWEI